MALHEYENARKPKIQEEKEIAEVVHMQLSNAERNEYKEKLNSLSVNTNRIDRIIYKAVILEKLLAKILGMSTKMTLSNLLETAFRKNLISSADQKEVAWARDVRNYLKHSSRKIESKSLDMVEKILNKTILELIEK